MRIFAYEIKVFLFVPQDWGTEGVEVLETLFYLYAFLLSTNLTTRRTLVRLRATVNRRTDTAVSFGLSILNNFSYPLQKGGVKKQLVFLHPLFLVRLIGIEPTTTRRRRPVLYPLSYKRRYIWGIESNQSPIIFLRLSYISSEISSIVLTLPSMAQRTLVQSYLSATKTALSYDC